MRDPTQCHGLTRKEYERRKFTLWAPGITWKDHVDMLIWAGAIRWDGDVLVLIN